MIKFSQTIFFILSISLFIISSLSLVNGAIDPNLNAQRISFLPSFLLKLTQNSYYAKNNFTTHTAPDYCWNIEYSGSFCGAAAEDYTQILFVQQPYFNQTTNTTEYLQVSFITIEILDIILYNDGLTNDTYVIKYILNNDQLNGGTFQYEKQDGLFYTAYYVFQKGSLLISTETIISQDGTLFNQAQFQQTDIIQLCGLITGLSCPVGTVYQNYSSFEECLQVMQSIDAQNQIHPCPDIQVSNTTSCRLLHAVVALTDPPISQINHCPHTNTPSTICIDYCTDVCDTCDVNAHCTFSVTPYGVRSYQCECNEGWVGNGTNCSRTNCTSTYQCVPNGAVYNYVGCNTSNALCYCQNTFVWNATSGACECQGNNSVWWINNTPICLEMGRCIDRTQCSGVGYNSEGVAHQAIGSWNQLNCEAYAQPTTLFPYNSCVCNYGYDGGFFVPCTCSHTEIWSPIIQGNVCIDTSIYCVANYSCPSGKVCNQANGPAYGVGICQ